MALLFSVRTAAEVIYHRELEQLAQQQANPIDLYLTFTRQPPSDWTGYRRRIARAMLMEILSRFAIQPQCFVCGSTQLVEQVANTLVDLDLPSDLIRTERFG